MPTLSSLMDRALRGVIWLEALTRPRVDGEMEIFVCSDTGGYSLEVDGSNTVWDVLYAVLGHISSFGLSPKPSLLFRGQMLEEDKSLSDYGIHDQCVLQLVYIPVPMRGPSNSETPPKGMLGRRKITTIGQPPVIWLKEYNSVLLDLMVEHTLNGQRNGGYFTRDSWCDIMARFNKATGSKYEIEHLEQRLRYYRREYRIVRGIMNHRSFGWDHHRQVVIATDADWNEYIKAIPEAKLYRTRTVPYFYQLQIVCL